MSHSLRLVYHWWKRKPSAGREDWLKMGITGQVKALNKKGNTSFFGRFILPKIIPKIQCENTLVQDFFAFQLI